MLRMVESIVVVFLTTVSCAGTLVSVPAALLIVTVNTSPFSPRVTSGRMRLRSLALGIS